MLWLISISIWLGYNFYWIIDSLMEGEIEYFLEAFNPRITKPEGFLSMTIGLYAFELLGIFCVVMFFISIGG